ncbi:MAG: hypothetical protein HYV32_00285 [Candidatus Kerfeldbacteria bacterium]|nr:hypothetical protein [Candidatus Kerfeldbacteria bacterium]
MKKKRTKVKATIKNMPRRQSLFWDVDPKTIDPKKHARYIIERILDYGSEDELRWLVSYYTTEKIKKTIRLSRTPIHKKSLSLWTLIFR